MKKLLLVIIIPCVSVFFILCTNSNNGSKTIKNLQWLDANEERTELSIIGKDVILFAQTENIKDGASVTITIWSKGDEPELPYQEPGKPVNYDV